MIARPYPGLRPFNRDEDEIFFGREIQLNQLLDKLADTNFLAVLGTSGSGKSSLVRAGLLPALDGGFMAGGGARWAVAELRPGDRPFHRLAASLVRDVKWGMAFAESKQTSRSGLLDGDQTPGRADDNTAPSDTDAAIATLERHLQRGNLALNWRLGVKPLPAGTRLLIIVDQFEELFRYQRTAAAEAIAFVALLLAAATHPSIYVVITLRSEFLSDCTRFPDLPEAINGGLFLTPRMNSEQMADAVQLPASLYGGEVEPEVANRLLEETRGEMDQLPLLQHALMRLWDLDDGDRRVTLKDLERLGGLRKALDDHAEEAFAELDTNRQRIAEVLFRCLTERGPEERDTRRPIMVNSVAAIAGVPPEEVMAIVEVFRRADRSFLTPSIPTTLKPDSILDISHESLIRQWVRLKQWVEEESLSAETYRRLEQTARLWKQGQAAVWGTPDLENALRWKDSTKPNTLWAERYRGNFELAMEFLNASEREQRVQAALAEEEGRRELQKARSLAEAQELRAEAERRRAEEQIQAARRVRRWAAVLAVVSVLAAAAAFYAWNQQKRAERLALTRLSGRLAAASMSNLRFDPERSILLALHGALATYEVDQSITEEVEQALHQAVLESRIRKTLSGHSAALHGVAFSPDGKRVATAAADGVVKVWDAGSDQEPLTLPDRADMVNDVVFSPDGKQLATANGNGTATLWDATSGRKVRVLSGHGGPVTSIEFSPDGLRVATGSKDKTGRIWEVASGKELFPLSGHIHEVNDVVFSRDGKRLVTAGGDRTAIVWDASGTQLRTLYGHEDAVIGVALHPDGNRLATVSADRTTKLWDMASGQLLLTMLGHTFNVNDVAFSPDGTRLATASGDGTAKVWDPDSGRELFTLFGHADFVSAIRFSPDGKLLATGSGDRTAKIWLTSEGEELLTLRGHESAVISVAFHPKGTLLATTSEDTTLGLWDATSGKKLCIGNAHAYHVNDVAFSPDGNLLATVSGDKTVKLWDTKSTKSCKVVTTFEGHEQAVFGVAFSPDGKRLATASFDGTAKLWELNSEQEVRTFAGHKAEVNDVAFAPDGRHLATASDDGTAKLWKTDSEQALFTFGGHGDLVIGVAFSPDGQLLATTSRDGKARLWDIESRETLFTLDGHTNTVFDVAFSPDGRRVVTTGWDKTARIWDVATGQELVNLSGHTDAVNGVAWSPDGNRLATASWDKTVKVYAINYGELIELARTRVTRSLTSVECRKYLQADPCSPLP